MAGNVERVYATALFELAQETDSLDAMAQELSAICEVFEKAPEMQKLLSAPTITSEEKNALLSSVFGERVSRETLSFLALCTDKGRAGYITKIIGEFRAMFNNHKNILEVTATTAQPLSDTLRAKLVEKLSAVSGKNIVLLEKLNPSILGGIVLSYNNTQLDASVKSRLDKMRSQINSIIA